MKNKLIKFILQSLLIIQFAGLMSCVSIRTVTPPPYVVLPRIEVNDKVQVLLRNGSEFKKLKVTSMDSSSLIGSYVSYRETKAITISNKDISGIQQLKVGKLAVIKPGCKINATLKNGEKIKRLKVKSVDSNKFEVADRIRNAHHRIVDSTRVINMSDIARIQVVVLNPNGTAGLVAGGMVIGVLIILIDEASKNPLGGWGYK